MELRSAFACVAALLLGQPALAATYEDGLRLKQEQKLEAAAVAFRDVLQREPDDTRALEQLAIVQSWLNRYDDAIAAWHRLLALTPDAVEARIGLARVLYWKGERQSALRELDVALGSEPENVDALILEGDVLMADGQQRGARAAYLHAQARAPGDAEIAKKIDRAVVPKAWRFDIGTIADDYSRERDIEGSAYAQLGYQPSPGATWYLRGDRYDNFGAIDTGLSTGGYFRIAPWLLLHAEAGLTLGEADFRLEKQAILNGEFLFDGPVQPLLGYRYSRYEQTGNQGDVTTITPGVRLVGTGWNVELRYARSENLDDSTTSVSQAKLSLERERFTAYLLGADGEEATPPLAVAQIRVIAIGAAFKLNETLGVRVDFAHEDRKEVYIHNALGVGVSYRF